MNLRTDIFTVNIGPQHPSTHGVFHMRLTLDGEVVIDVQPVLGYLHRGTEKLCEGTTYTQAIPYTDRLDYLSAMSNNLAYVLAVEMLTGTPVPERGEYLRVIMAELQRLANHLSAVGFFLNDLGAFFTPLLYCWREREKILDLFEMTCGARLTYNYMRVGGVSQDVPEEFLPALKTFLADMPRYIDEYEALLSENEIVLARTRGVGILPPDLAINASASGPLLRASGVRWDWRKADPYCIYDRFDFDVPVGQAGDVYDRYKVRIEEMRQSVRILNQAVRDLPNGPVKTDMPIVFYAPPGEAYGRIEAPKGELAFYLVSDGSPAPYRFHIRAPSFINITALRDMIVGWKVADAITIFGSIDVVIGELDR